MGPAPPGQGLGNGRPRGLRGGKRSEGVLSNPDSFINEVSEELRRDRFFGWVRRYGWIVGLLLVVGFGAAAWNEWRKAQDRAAAEAFGNAVLSALEADDLEARTEALAAIEADGRRAAVLGLLKAGEAAEAGDEQGALAALEDVETASDAGQRYQQLAMLKRVMILGSDMPEDEREATLRGLAESGQPFSALAREQLALLQIEQGDDDAAIETLRALMDRADATAGLRRRATQLMVALGADPQPQS